MKLTRMVVLAVLLPAMLVLAASCRKEQAKAPAVVPKVAPTAAYLTHFGEPPVVEEGTAHAMVGYLPLAADPGKVVPLPLFLFSETNRMQLLVERLLTVTAEASERIGTFNPFPSGTLLNTLVQDGDLLTVDLGGVLQLPGDPDTWRNIHAVLGHSLLQFPGVQRVRVTIDGDLPPGYPADGAAPDAGVVASPGEPQVIGIVGVWEPGAAQPEELSVFFDRPLKVNHAALMEHGGGPVEGEQFVSVFDMAVVIQPKNAGHIQEGQPMTVSYDVVDRLGRTAKGEKTFPLSRLEHP